MKYMKYWNMATLTQSIAEVRDGLHILLLLFSSIFSHTSKSVVVFCIRQDTCIQIAIGCDIALE